MEVGHYAYSRRLAKTLRDAHRCIEFLRERVHNAHVNDIRLITSRRITSALKTSLNKKKLPSVIYLCLQPIHTGPDTEKTAHNG